MNPGDKTKAIEDALSWLRANEPSLENIDEPSMLAFSRLTGVGLPPLKIPEKKRITQEAMTWLRSNQPNTADLDEPTVLALAKLAGVPVETKMTPSEKKQIMEESVVVGLESIPHNLRRLTSQHCWHLQMSAVFLFQVEFLLKTRKKL